MNIPRTHRLPARIAAVLAAAALAAPPARAALVDASRFPSAQAALDAAADGDRVWFPAGRYAIPRGGLVIARGIELFGDGEGSTHTTGTCFAHADARDDAGAFLVLRAAPGSARGPCGVRLHDFRIEGQRGPAPAADSLGHGIWCRQDGRFARGAVAPLLIERVTVAGVPGDGIHLEGGDLGVHSIQLATIRDCHVVECGGDGVRLRNAVTTTVSGGFTHENGRCGLVADDAPSLVVDHLAIEHNQRAPGAPRDAAQVVLRACHAFRLSSPYVEDYAAAGGPVTGVRIENCWGGVIEGGFFTNPAAVPGACGIRLGRGTNAVQVAGNAFDLADSMVVLANDPSCTNNAILPQAALRAADGARYAVGVGPAAAGNFVFDWAPGPAGGLPRAGGGLTLPSAGAPASRRPGTLWWNPATRRLAVRDSSGSRDLAPAPAPAPAPARRTARTR